MMVINDNGTEKLVHEGKVAVLVSRGYGAGWSTWSDENKTKRLFDPALASLMVERDNKLKVLGYESEEVLDEYHKRIEEVAEERYPEDYLGGLSGLEIHWLERGTRFTVDEYDGAESITTLDDTPWNVA